MTATALVTVLREIRLSTDFVTFAQAADAVKRYIRKYPEHLENHDVLLCWLERRAVQIIAHNEGPPTHTGITARTIARTCEETRAYWDARTLEDNAERQG